MEATNHEYHVSFFKPKNDRARVNRNIIAWILSIWILAVFGFQIALKIIEEPVPEPAYTEYEKVKDAVYSDDATKAELRKFAQVPLQVLAKVLITPEERDLLQKSLSWSIFSVVSEEKAETLKSKINSFRASQESMESITDPDYKASKQQLASLGAKILELPDNDIRLRVLPFEITTDYPQSLSAEMQHKLDDIFSRYLIHNQSVLTDTRVLGFPLHYFYTAVFLLIMFVVLCWIYCIQATAADKKYNIVNE
jgi:putative solute:sodium symporter small subunit